MMEFSHITSIDKRKKADALVIPFWKTEKKPESVITLAKTLRSILEPLLETDDFAANEGEVLFFYTADNKEKRIALVGLGKKDKISPEVLRRCYGSLIKNCRSKKLKSLNLIFPDISSLNEKQSVEAITEGLLLPNYEFSLQKQRKQNEDSNSLIQEICWIGGPQNLSQIVKKIQIICDGVYYVRDLVNGNADDITPAYLGACARGIGKEFPSIKVTVLDKKQIIKENLNLLLAVNRGSALDPAFIVLQYKNNPHSKDHTVLVGKGVTYDTGGLNIKSANMEIMKADMAAAAVCLGTLMVAANLGIKVNLSAVIPVTENSTDALSFKPGDVYTSHAGKSVEMINSDAEGRLILADGLSYAQKHLKPTRLIDLATLTGAMDIVLGPEASGLMSTDDSLSQDLIQAGEDTYERLWRLPLFEEYKERLKSDIADIKNWNGRIGGANVAATFLREFVDPALPWAHLDIASTAYVTDAKKYQPKYATGFGLRLLVKYLESLK